MELNGILASHRCPHRCLRGTSVPGCCMHLAQLHEHLPILRLGCRLGSQCVYRSSSHSLQVSLVVLHTGVPRAKSV